MNTSHRPMLLLSPVLGLEAACAVVRMRKLQLVHSPLVVLTLRV